MARRLGFAALALVGLSSVLLLLYGASYPFGDFGPTIAGMVGLLISGGIWTLARIATTVERRRANLPTESRWSWLLPSVLVACLVCLLALNVPLRVRWAASRSAFDAKVHAGATAHLSMSAQGDAIAGRVGLYSIVQVTRDGSNVYFYDEQSGSSYPPAGGGFAYLPGGPSSAQRANSLWRFTALGDGWYGWEEDA